MIKTNYQKAAKEYAQHYVEYLLDMEGMLGQQVERRLNELIEQKIKEYMSNINNKH
ncbi:MAG: hypothetical protein IKZ62_01255 [Prevotella sp.]|nr:hypothetical protein [Prevotella sp.]